MQSHQGWEGEAAPLEDWVEPEPLQGWLEQPVARLEWVQLEVPSLLAQLVGGELLGRLGVHHQPQQRPLQAVREH